MADLAGLPFTSNLEMLREWSKTKEWYLSVWKVKFNDTIRKRRAIMAYLEGLLRGLPSLSKKDIA